MVSSNVSKKTIDFIEDNLFDNLNLETIATTMNYSKYHFHRMFLYEMGHSVTDYLRMRRIIRAASRLLNSDDKITHIALNYGFTNVDTFIRCFRRYYGITPSKYRKLSSKVKKTYNEECKYMMNFTYELKKCNDEDKKQAIKSLDQIIELSRVAHKSGLLALEDYSSNNCTYIDKCIELLLDGIEPLHLRSILSNYVITSNLTSLELLQRVIYLEGILLIQKGEYPWNIRKSLSSFFGEEYICKLNEYYQSNKNIKDVLEIYKCKEAISLETKILNKELKGITKRSMQRLLRECDIILIAIAFIGSGMQLKRMVIESLPKGRLEIFPEVINLIGEPTLAQIVDSQNEILKIIKNLRISTDI